MERLHRLRCEARQIIAWSRSCKDVREYLDMVEQKRGKAARDELRNAAADQKRLGNTGKYGEWK